MHQYLELVLTFVKNIRFFGAGKNSFAPANACLKDWSFHENVERNLFSRPGKYLRLPFLQRFRNFGLNGVYMIIGA